MDWSQTRAFWASDNGVTLNVRGREPAGIVAPGAEYEALREEIKARLLALREPQTGERVVAEVWKREEIYSGPYVDWSPDLRNNIWINPAEAPGMSINWDAGTISGGDNLDAGEGGGKRDDLIGWDFYDNDNNPIQTFAGNNHGTHVAGCAGAVGDNEIGVVGTCPIVSIISCKGAPSNSPSTGIAYGYDQIKYAAEIRADIINASWGGPGAGAYPNSIVNYATALGSLVVTAAGNDNKEHDSSYQDYPADCVQALCVASTGQGDVKSNFSDYGAPIDPERSIARTKFAALTRCHLPPTHAFHVW